MNSRNERGSCKLILPGAERFVRIRHMNSYLILLISFVLNSGCSYTPVMQLLNNTKQEKLYDVRYGADPRHVMDVFLPQGRSLETPFVLIIHGGAWVRGDKQMMREYQQRLLARGIASANVNHRYAGGRVHVSDMLDDIDKAYATIADSAARWSVRADHFVMSGHSSGGHLSLLYSYRTKRPVNAIVALSAPSDLSDTLWLNLAKENYAISSIEGMVGAPYAKGNPLNAGYLAASPVLHIKPIPTLLIHGTFDFVVPYRQSEKLAAELKAKGIPHKLYSIVGEGHSLSLKGPASTDRMFEEIIAWINQYGSAL